MDARISLIIVSLLWCQQVIASGNSIDKVYHPYVMPMEIEVEWRSLYQQDNDRQLDNVAKHKLGIGYSPAEYWFTEIELTTQRNGSDGYDVDAIAFEAIWQLTEQGEYDADWGLLFELERDIDAFTWEISTTVLVEREWGKWVTTANLAFEYEWGKENEFETGLSLQARYRLNRYFEPALELYQSQGTTGIGPVALGDFRLGLGKKLHWEFGVIFGLKSATPSQTLRALLEYEF